MSLTPRLVATRRFGGSLRLWRVALLALSLFAIGVAPAVASGPAPDRSTARFEIDFMQDMIDHHAMAVMMAEICLDKAVHAELRSLCQNIMASQSQEIQQMQSWLQSWYGVSHLPAETKDTGQMKQLERASGAEFEIRFMEMMIRHHRAAIKEAETCLDRAYHPELKQLCQNIIRTQSAEIQQLETWLCQWYGRCDGRRRAS
jgi:uncharacterized protein (DUF305 family)